MKEIFTNDKNIHCEIHLIFELLRNDVKDFSFIGISKYCCPLCRRNLECLIDKKILEKINFSGNHASYYSTRHLKFFLPDHKIKSENYSSFLHCLEIWAENTEIFFELTKNSNQEIADLIYLEAKNKNLSEQILTKKIEFAINDKVSLINLFFYVREVKHYVDNICSDNKRIVINNEKVNDLDFTLNDTLDLYHFLNISIEQNEFIQKYPIIETLISRFYQLIKLPNLSIRNKIKNE